MYITLSRGQNYAYRLMLIDLLLCVLISLNTNISSQRMEFICNKFLGTYTNIYVSINNS